jgi:hypothetical protein
MYLEALYKRENVFLATMCQKFGEEEQVKELLESLEL